MKKLFKNQRGFSHHLILPIAVIAAVAGIGSYVLVKSKAASLTDITGCTPVIINRPLEVYGSSGGCVKRIQYDLDWIYKNPDGSWPLSVDGKFGPQTLKYVKLFQSQYKASDGSKLVVDGKVGVHTWSGLYLHSNEYHVLGASYPAPYGEN